MSPPTPTPMVLIGQTPRVGKFVAAKLLPEFEVIHFVSDIEQAKAEMATIMAGGEPPQDPGHVSSHNFSQLPRHIVFGKGFQWPKLQEVRESAGNEDSGLCWYWAPLAPGEIPTKAADVPNISDETLHMQTDKIVANMKRCLGEVIRDGKEGRDGVYSLAPPAPAAGAPAPAPAVPEVAAAPVAA